MSQSITLYCGLELPLVIDQMRSSANLVMWKEVADDAAWLAANAAAVEMVISAGHVGLSADFQDQFANLKMISSFGVGYDHIDAKHAASRGIMVTHTPDVLSDEVADTAIAMMLMVVRELGAAERYLRAGQWAKQGDYPLTATLKGRTLGIFGLGRIGKAIAHRAEAFGLDILYHGRNKQADVAYPYYDSLEGLAQACDILLAVVPGGAATDKAVNGRVLAALGADGYLINIGRGSTVDEPALIEALKSGEIAGAALDVFANEPNVPEELLALEQVVLLPHVGSASVETRRAMAQLVVDNAQRFQAGEAVITPVLECQSK